MRGCTYRAEVASLCAGHILVRFYGERSIMWAKESELEQGCLTERHIADLQTWGRTRQKSAPNLCAIHIGPLTDCSQLQDYRLRCNGMHRCPGCLKQPQNHCFRQYDKAPDPEKLLQIKLVQCFEIVCVCHAQASDDRGDTLRA